MSGSFIISILFFDIFISKYKLYGTKELLVGHVNLILCMYSHYYTCSGNIPPTTVLKTMFQSLSVSPKTRLHSLGSAAQRQAMTHLTFARAQMQPR